MINEELGLFISTIIATILREKLLGEIQPKITPMNRLKGWKDLLNKENNDGFKYPIPHNS